MISSSPGRLSFQKDSYIQRQKDHDKPISESYIEMFDTIITNHNHRFDDPESQKNNLEYDLLTTDWILSKARGSKVYSQNLYAAMCNNNFQKRDVFPILADQTWSCSWRYAGGIIADMRQEGDYMDWYCSGIRNNEHLDDESYQALSKDQQDFYTQTKQYVGESVVTNEINEDLTKLGWSVIENNET